MNETNQQRADRLLSEDRASRAPYGELHRSSLMASIPDGPIQQSLLLVALDELVATKKAYAEYQAASHGGESEAEVFGTNERLEGDYFSARTVFMARLRIDTGLDGNIVADTLSKI